MHSKKYLALFLVICMMSSDFLIPVVLAGHHGRGGHGLELLLAAGILAKLLRKKGHHGHHHHHHGHHGHHHGRSGGGMHLPHEAGAQTVEVVHVAPPLGGYSSYYPSPSSYGNAQAATSSFSASIEYPFSPAASHQLPMHHIPYGASPSAASFLGYEPQPVQVYPPLPLDITGESGDPGAL